MVWDPEADQNNAKLPQVKENREINYQEQKVNHLLGLNVETKSQFPGVAIYKVTPPNP